MMRHSPVRVALAVVAFSSLHSGAVNGSRVCGSTPGTYQTRLIDLRWDGADPSKGNQFATFAASLGNGATPLYECNSQWPEAWAGWYEGGNSSIIWSDCIWTGAGSGPDKTVSFALDWRTKIMYMSHTFACSDKRGSDGLATGTINLDLNCSTTTDSLSYCVPKSNTAAGTRPSVLVSTKLLGQISPLNSNAEACAENAKRYQSWRLENWHRQFVMPPSSLTPGVPDKTPSSDTGPSFKLTNLASNGVFNCSTAPAKEKDHVFEGVCESMSESTTTTAKFSFDPQLALLTVEQHWNCSPDSIFDAVGIEFMQAACDRNFNSDVFTCTSDPVWIGTKTV
ncbi:hypothetical protein B0T17DRAFT_300502 [Bombardia bombarda]|uniref:Uncharacterized protein n=1 Tax=Bombardia bombarda TaxID=252184 RepID=A0AA39WUI3_9PEZI|nr:hypothetical protein B0T17DRAFT_300502 [Bombardia bombarda]